MSRKRAKTDQSTKRAPMRAGTNRDLAIAYAALAASGFAGLGYEMVWTRMFAQALGHELPAALAVVSAYFSGLSLGAWTIDRRISRSRRPGHWYVGCELAIGVWAIVSMLLVPLASEYVLRWTGVTPSAPRQWFFAFGVPFMVLLPSTFAMGATLPAMDRFVAHTRADDRVVGGLYAANTFGAVLGTLATVFLLIPHLGYRQSLGLLAAVNVAGAAMIAVLPSFRRASEPSPAATAVTSISPARLDVTLFLTGYLGISYQLLAVTVIAQVTENTVYSFALSLAVYLLGTAFGATVYQRYLRNVSARDLLALLLVSAATACLFGVLMLGRAQSIYESLRQTAWLGGLAPLVAEAALALVVFTAPVFVMGATFSHLSQSARAHDGGVGRAIGVNTLGGAIAPLAAVALLPALGSLGSLAAMSVAYLALLPTAKPRLILIMLLPACLLLALPRNLTLVRPPDGGRTLEMREGLMGAVAVVEDRRGQRYLKVNDRFHMGATVNPSNERRLAHLPLLLHASPKRMLFLGIGTGATLAAALDQSPESLVGVELVPEVVELQPMFSAVTGDLQSAESLQIVTADARRYVRATNERFDVVVADLFHPARDGAGSLYTREHFRAIRGALDDEGIFCQWLPLYQMDQETLSYIVRTFLAEFPHARGYYSHLDVEKPVLGLVGWQKPTQYAANWFDRRAANPPLRRALLECGITDGIAFFGFYAASAEQLRMLAGAGQLNTDDFPVVTFHAPRFAYDESANTRQGLVWLLERIQADPTEQVLGADRSPDNAFANRLTLYVRARDVFLHGELARTAGDEPSAIKAYLESARISADFEVGYLIAFSVAQRLATEGKASQAVAVLDSLIEIAPGRREPRLLRDSLRAAAAP